jgi:hypothetical protein
VANMESKKLDSLANSATTPSSSNTAVVRRRQKFRVLLRWLPHAESPARSS